jgi:hypothetical protein
MGTLSPTRRSPQVAFDQPDGSPSSSPFSSTERSDSNCSTRSESSYSSASSAFSRVSDKILKIKNLTLPVPDSSTQQPSFLSHKTCALKSWKPPFLRPNPSYSHLITLVEKFEAAIYDFSSDESDEEVQRINAENDSPDKIEKMSAKVKIHILKLQKKILKVKNVAGYSLIFKRPYRLIKYKSCDRKIKRFEIKSQFFIKKNKEIKFLDLLLITLENTKSILVEHDIRKINYLPTYELPPDDNLVYADQLIHDCRKIIDQEDFTDHDLLEACHKIQLAARAVLEA